MSRFVDALMKLTVYMLRPVEINVNEERQRLIQERAAAKRCILDDCQLPVRSRGLCSEHYEKFKQTARNPPNNLERDEFIELAIAEGKVLPAGEQRRLRPTTNPFANVGSEVPDHVA